ncbi:MAG: glycosyltransferase family 4 protein [Planctomycetota bacterium]|jgi:UDP-GlcNAc:undecaprenyl-phosphate GlcNAc-1-phosphate transferase
MKVPPLILDRLSDEVEPVHVEPITGGAPEAIGVSALNLLNSYAHIFVIAFVVTLLATPIVRRFAIAADVVDRPDSSRKQHPYPVAYLGGVAVFIGLVVAIGMSYFTNDEFTAEFMPVPIAVVIGMGAIMFTGFADDVWGWDPRLKIAGQLVAAAALALFDVGVRVAEGLLIPFVGSGEEVLLSLGSLQLLNSDLFYWSGTALIAIFVLGGCNAANLLDGLDGLLSGTVAIIAVGLLVICLLVAPTIDPQVAAGSLAGARIVLCIALLGAVLGFLPHNWNPASIFLGDCGSLLLGYMCVVTILMLGDLGQTHLVFAGLIVFSVPIMDTVLAIIRRLLAGKPMSSADDKHIHHQLKSALGGVKKAVFALYGISALFGVVGVGLVALVIMGLRVRFVYAIALVLFGFIGVIAVKSARQLPAVQKRAAAKPAAASSGGAADASKESAVRGEVAREQT